MKLVQTIHDLRREIRAARDAGKTIGLVPTMGALHPGHISLVRSAKIESDYVAVSIFVNPKQFGPHEDFHRYPRPLDEDLNLCQMAGADLVFQPAVEEMYPEGFSTFVEVPGVSAGLCGDHRPGHFRGVATVVMKLFQQVQPDQAYFGQKDAQQCAVIRKMIRDLDLNLKMITCPTVREHDGLAMSSRNRYLSDTQRKAAPGIFAALEALRREALEKGGHAAAPHRQRLLEQLQAIPGAQVEYAEIVHADTLKAVETLEFKTLVAVAVRFGNTRLIDNILIEIPDPATIR